MTSLFVKTLGTALIGAAVLSTVDFNKNKKQLVKYMDTCPTYSNVPKMPFNKEIVRFMDSDKFEAFMKKWQKKSKQLV
jgi:hypothetical protein